MAKPDIRELIFRSRSYIPLPFLIIAVLFAEPSMASIAAGLVVIAAGEAIRFWGVSIVGAETRTTGAVGGTYLVTSGPYSHVRNPLYLGNMLMYAGVGLMSMALFPWLLVFACIWFYLQYYLIVTREEEYLAERFGDAFGEYTRHVGRFIPRMRGYQASTPPPKSLNPAAGLASERRTLQAIGLATLLFVGIYLAKHWRP